MNLIIASDPELWPCIFFFRWMKQLTEKNLLDIIMWLHCYCLYRSRIRPTVISWRGRNHYHHQLRCLPLTGQGVQSVRLKQRRLRSVQQTQQLKEGSSYTTVAENLRKFVELGCSLSVPFELSRLDEGCGIEKTLLQNKAKFHHSCR